MQTNDNLVRPGVVVNEGVSAFVDITFKDEDDVDAVPSTAVYTLFDKLSGAVINSRSGVAVPGSGASRTIELTPADNAIQDETLDVEEHRLYIKYTYGGGGAKTGSVEVQIHVANMAKE